MMREFEDDTSAAPRNTVARITRPFERCRLLWKAFQIACYRSFGNRPRFGEPDRSPDMPEMRPMEGSVGPVATGVKPTSHLLKRQHHESHRAFLRGVGRPVSAVLRWEEQRKRRTVLNGSIDCL